VSDLLVSLLAEGSGSSLFRVAEGGWGGAWALVFFCYRSMRYFSLGFF